MESFQKNLDDEEWSAIQNRLDTLLSGEAK